MPSATTIAQLTALAAPALGVWLLGACAGGAQAEDRYGPPHPADSSAQAAAATSGWLSWPTKTTTRDGADSIGAAPQPASSVAAPQMRNGRLAALPTSLYSAYPLASPRESLPREAPPRDAPGPWTPTRRTTATSAPAQPATGQAPRFYSVHREFGLKPDPIPLPPQFFASSAGADLAAPPPPLDPHPVPGTQAATSPLNTAANRAREVELETADSAAN